MKNLDKTPQTMAEALEMGFEESSSASGMSDDQGSDEGVMTMRHPDGRSLDIPFRAVYTYGQPTLDQEVTKANRWYMAHPERDFCKTGILVPVEEMV